MSHKKHYKHHTLRDSDDDETFLRLATLSSDAKDPYSDHHNDGPGDVEMSSIPLSGTSHINTVTDIGVQTELNRLDMRIDKMHKKVYRLGCCGPKRLALVVLILLILLVVNYVLDFWHMITYAIDRFEKSGSDL